MTVIQFRPGDNGYDGMNHFCCYRLEDHDTHQTTLAFAQARVSYVRCEVANAVATPRPAGCVGYATTARRP